MTEARETRPRRWPQLWRWLAGLAIVLVLASRVPFHAFGHAIHEGRHLRLALADFLILAGMLLTDTLATWISLSSMRLRWSLRDTLVARGATYVLSLLSYTAGQGGIGYYLHRSGVPKLRAAGISLFMIGTTFATLLLMTTMTWALGITRITMLGAWWTLLGGCAAFGVYLVVIEAAPRRLEGRDLLSPLFEAGLRGHALTIFSRIPHVTIIVLGHWLALAAWGIPVPFTVAAAVLPMVAIVTALPISPAGLGTTQAALVYFFSGYAAGTTGEARMASILAFSIVHFVYGVAGQLLVGLACIPMARTIQPLRPL